MAIRDLNHLTFNILTWTDLCPIGKDWRNTKLEDVDPGYLLWLYRQDWLYEKYPALHKFIKDNYQEIQDNFADQNR